MINGLIMASTLTTSLVLLFFGRKIGFRGAQIITIIVLIVNLLLFYSGKNNFEESIILRDWINIDIFNEKFLISSTYETRIMLLLITCVSSTVLVYSFWYMKNEPKIVKFISLLFLFSFSMVGLVSTMSYLNLYAYWEFVGIISSMLIGYWHGSENSRKSGLKALIYNKFGDLALLSAISLMLTFFGSTDFYFLNIFQHTAKYLIIFIAIAAMAKSGQFFLTGWLSDAMTGPTPVSALLHAATMVTAGVYLLIRTFMQYLAEDLLIKSLVQFIGVITVILTSLLAISEWDSKKIVAYSTASQLAYIYISSTYAPNLALFHLIGHGYFKALLFLAVGILIHKNLFEQDIRKYGCFDKVRPMSLFLLLALLSLSATPFLSGYFSKEYIIAEATLFPNFIIYIILLFGALLTLTYCVKLYKYLILSFPGSNNAILTH